MSCDEHDFNKYAEAYDDALNCGISLSGEEKKYFARGRICWLARCLRTIGETPVRVLDYGCGIGSSSPFFHEFLGGIGHLLGVDISEESVKLARAKFGSLSHFQEIDEWVPDGTIDLVYSNGVFHHIPPDSRGEALAYVYEALRPRGILALFENNSWNPATRLVMKRIPFDRDAIAMSPREAIKNLRGSGFQIIYTNFLFVFPRWLQKLRVLEPHIARLPLGTQYMVLCRKP